MTAPLVAVIPARAGSERLPGKNTRMFAGKPLIQHTIEAAQQSGVPFDEILVTTDDAECCRIAQVCGLEPYQRHRYLAQATTSMRETLLDLALNAWPPDHAWLDDLSFMVLYPTYALRTASDVQAIYERWARDCDGGRLGLIGTLSCGLEARAVDPVDVHPRRVRARYPDIYRTQDSAPTMTTGTVFCHFACVIPVRHLGVCSPQLITDSETVEMPLDQWARRAYEVDTGPEWALAEDTMRSAVEMRGQA